MTLRGSCPRLAAALGLERVKWRLRFPARALERTFQLYLAPKVARTTLLFHFAALVIHGGSLLRGAEQESSYAAAATALSVQFLACVVLTGVTMSTDLHGWCEWASVLSTAAVCSALSGACSTAVSDLSGAVERDRLYMQSDVLRMSAVILMTQSYAVYVPVRSCVLWALPLLLSGALLALSFLSPSSPISGPQVLTFIVLLFQPLPAAHAHEQVLRERWVAERQVCKQSKELLRLSQMSGYLCDATFRLTPSLTFWGEDPQRDSYLGRAVEGQAFASFLSTVDMCRLQDALWRLEQGHGPTIIPASLCMASGNCAVSLYIAEIEEGCEERGAVQYSISVLSSTITRTCESFDKVETGHSEYNLSEAEARDIAMPIPGSIHSHNFGGGSLMSVVPSLLSEETDEEMDFTISASTVATTPITSMGNGRSQGGGGRVFSGLSAFSSCATFTTTSTQTCNFEDSGFREVGTNTSIVWSTEGFQCTACQKPPLHPQTKTMRLSLGRRTAALPVKSKRKEKPLAPARVKYDGNVFDGQWVLSQQDAKHASAWLRCMVIQGSLVVLGDGDVDHLLVDEHGEVSLCGGLLLLDGPNLVRVGKSGRAVVLNPAENQEAGYLLERLEPGQPGGRLAGHTQTYGSEGKVSETLSTDDFADMGEMGTLASVASLASCSEQRSDARFSTYASCHASSSCASSPEGPEAGEG